MASNPNLFAAVQGALGAVASANLSSTSASNDLYEAYIWSLVLDAAWSEGATINFRNRSGQAPTAFWFRTSPSSIFSDRHDYCHAEIHFDGCPVLEAHVGIYVSGRSKVSHECDVAVLHKSEADICRAKSVEPRSGKVILTVECKHYTSSNAGIGLGRSFLGLLHDIYNGYRFFVATRSTTSVARLFAKHNKHFEMGVSPADPHLEARLTHSFEHCFRNFISSERN